MDRSKKKKIEFITDKGEACGVDEDTVRIGGKRYEQLTPRTQDKDKDFV